MTVPAHTTQALAWTTLKALRGETVRYHVGSASVELTAVFAKPDASQVDTEDNLVLESRAWDVLIDPAWPSSAPAAFSGLEPGRGHKIVRADGSTYFVQPSDSNQTCWRWSDALHTWRRVHTEAK